MSDPEIIPLVLILVVLTTCWVLADHPIVLDLMAPFQARLLFAPADWFRRAGRKGG